LICGFFNGTKLGREVYPERNAVESKGAPFGSLRFTNPVNRLFDFRGFLLAKSGARSLPAGRFIPIERSEHRGAPSDHRDLSNP